MKREKKKLSPMCILLEMLKGIVKNLYKVNLSKSTVEGNHKKTGLQICNILEHKALREVKIAWSSKKQSRFKFGKKWGGWVVVDG